MSRPGVSGRLLRRLFQAFPGQLLAVVLVLDLGF